MERAEAENRLDTEIICDIEEDAAEAGSVRERSDTDRKKPVGSRAVLRAGQIRHLSGGRHRIFVELA